MKKDERIKISKNNIMEFEGLKKAKGEISQKYLATINYKAKSAIYAIVCMIFFILGVIGFCSIPTISKNATTAILVATIVTSALCLLVAILFVVVDVLDRQKILYAQRGIPYIADCYVYDKEKVVKKDKEGNEIEYYNVKVEDTKGRYINKWYAVDKSAFDTTDDSLVFLVFDYESKYDYDVRTKKSLNIKDVQSEQLDNKEIVKDEEEKE